MQQPDRRSGLSNGRSQDNREHCASCHDVVMSEKCFRLLSDFIHTSCGIKMPPSKKTLLEGRLRKRLRTLRMHSFVTYCDYLFSPVGMASESGPMIDLVTTNKTDFFRESAHFDFLVQRVLPEMVESRGIGIQNDLAVWSAGCSTGEEPYTLAMVLCEFAEKQTPFRFSVLGTDISSLVLERAVRAIYDHERVLPIPMDLRQKYLLRSKDRTKDLVRMSPELRSRVRFQRLNFMEEDYGVRESISVIFCRNVLIYFDKPTQEKMLNKLCRCLVPGGYLFMGHSETLHGLHVPHVRSIEGITTVYRKH